MTDGKKGENTNKKVALLLTGGGARAAYQVGVLKALAQHYPRNSKIPFEIICGTSAGAINATGLACYASCFHLGVKKIEWVWRNFHTHQVYYSDYLRLGWHLLRGFLSAFQADYANKRPVSLLDNKPLRLLLHNIVDLQRIDRNIQGGYLSSVSVTASSYNTGDSITFFQGNDAKEWRRAKRCGQKTLLGIHHLLASAAIPLVFPSVRIHQHYYGDGSVNQLSPLSAPIHLGADKILIIGLEQPRAQDLTYAMPHHPGLATVAGHLLDTIFSDTLNADLERMHRINKTIDTLNAHQIPTDLKKVDSFLINPSVNFNQIASQHFLQLPMAVRSLLRLTGITQHSESSLTSYLLFEKSYTKRLIEIGYQDAMQQMQQLLEFLRAE
ncbi:patatin-like phospholipase family protein [Rheinheimera mesophila]|uniref:Patatin-like phospholipase family protein n=1 Tax=Rheinheimera mesophila TaxID=1547515 RepID=A0A3P3QSU7_9GAMM|nr:patatin-like phospholipase family protein [Rheinheimera mesophila]KKL02003.1 patatin [Rheinheimera mesophila]RRJ23343.1 patatin-like phospholipase family protein [Rheinheimera mesophila]